MNRSPLIVVAGLVSVLVFHGVLAAAYLKYSEGRVPLAEAMLRSEKELQRRRLNLCGDQRCPRVEGRQRRRRLEEPKLEEPEILSADLIPALGGVAPDPSKLPELESYLEPDRVEEAINLENQDPNLKKLIKSKDPKKTEDPLDHRSELDKLLDEHRNDDPRVNRKRVEDITGFKDGEIGGAGMVRRLGNAYSAKAGRVMSRYFKVPPFLDDATLRKLKAKVKVTHMGFDGAILDYRVVKLSGDRTFDDAALATIKRFSSKDGGSQRLPAPDAKVLRYINAKGLVITLDGRLLGR